MSIPFGSSLNNTLVPATQLKGLGVAHWVPENDGKWEVQQNADGTWNFTLLDNLIATYQVGGGMRPRYHNAVGHLPIPGVTVTAANWQSLIQARFAALEAHYGGWGRFSSIDVVNEPFEGYASGAPTGYIRDSFWYEASGQDPKWWWYPYQLLNTVTPRLCVNDYDWLWADTAEGLNKFTTGLAAITAAKAAGVRIDTVCEQLHYRPDWPFDPATTIARLQAFAALGVTFEITEANVLVLPGMAPADAATALANVIQVFKDNCALEAVTCWSSYNPWGTGTVLPAVQDGAATPLIPAIMPLLA